MLNYVIWNMNPEIFTIGSFGLRYYGLFFAAAFFVGYKIMESVYKREGLSNEELDRLSVTMVISVVIGARLGHVLFYEPQDYFAHPLEILKIWKGGLASHGAAIGILIGLYIYSRRPAVPSYMWIMDRIILTVPIGGAFVRLGNLMNSEIYGHTTKLPWGFVYVRDLPEEATKIYPQLAEHAVKFTNKLPLGIAAHHPTQIYEALGYFLIFAILYFLYRKTDSASKPGRLFGMFLILLFTLRFFVEFLKEVQVEFEKGMALNMGQLLSIPFVAVGIFILIRSFRVTPEEKI
jgi:prolipoprotein diacylglyceryl transferase